MSGDIDESDIGVEVDVTESAVIDSVENVESLFGWGDSNNFRIKRLACSCGISRNGVRQIPLNICASPRNVIVIINHSMIQQ